MDNPLMEKKFCPFCLAYNDNYKFMHTTKSGKPSKTCICPSCNESFRLQSFHEINDMSIEEFGEWVAQYAYFGFWKKVKNFDEWICQKHWGVVPRKYRKLYSMAKRKYKKGAINQERCDAIWNKCKDQAYMNAWSV